MRSKRSRQSASEQRKSSTERCQPWRMIRCQALAASLARSLRYREKDPSGEQNQAVLRRGLSSSSIFYVIFQTENLYRTQLRNGLGTERRR